MRKFSRNGFIHFLWCANLILAILMQHALIADVGVSIEAILDKSDLKDTVVSYYVEDLTTGEPLAERLPDQLMIPASNMKLFTSAAALSLLGKDYAFETQLKLIEASRKRVSTDGTENFTHRTLLIRGSGDPAFGDPVMLEKTPPQALNGTKYEGRKLDLELMLEIWVDQVLLTNEKAIDEIVVDDRIFDRMLVHPDWPKDQLNNWYCAPVSGLNFHTNVLHIYGDGSQSGQAPKISIYPKSKYYRVINRALGGTSQTFWAARQGSSNSYILSGKVRGRMQVPIQVSMRHPAHLLGHVLAERLRQKGVRVEKVRSPELDEVFIEGKRLHTIRTPIIDVLNRCNKNSHNLYAEALLKKMGRKVTGSAGGWQNGAAAVRMFMVDKIGAKAARVQVVDGSGMSQNNKITAKVTVNLLKMMYRDKERYNVFLGSLAEGGKDGSLARYFNPSGMRGKLFGKTGYINGVRSLSGYLIIPTDRFKHTVAFSILFNNVKPPVYGPQIRAVRDSIIKIIDKEL